MVEPSGPVCIVAASFMETPLPRWKSGGRPPRFRPRPFWPPGGSNVHNPARPFGDAWDASGPRSSGIAISRFRTETRPPLSGNRERSFGADFLRRDAATAGRRRRPTRE